MATGEVLEICDYPLTGARANSHDEIEVCAGGFINNKLFVLYDAENAEGPYKRISQKRARSLAQLSAKMTKWASADLLTIRGGRDSLETVVFDAPADVEINEFGELTPAVDRGDTAADWFQEFTGIKSIRLAQKKLSWQRGVDRDMAHAMVAPLHIITKQSVEGVKSILEGRGGKVRADRFRSNLLLDMPDLEPFAENNCTEIRIGNVTLKIARLTERCGVTGNDQKTGQKIGDIPSIFGQLPQSLNGEPVVGIYAYPVIDTSASNPTIRKTDPVELVF